MNSDTLTGQRNRIVERYRASGQSWPATARQIASWAINAGLWTQRRETLVDQCAAELARAMGQEYYTDPQGRSVRTKHAARTTRDGVQATFWADIRTVDPEHMQIAIHNRRSRIVGECTQLKPDVDSYNENRNSGVPIQLVLDFTADVAEAEALESLGRSPVTDANEQRQPAERSRDSVLVSA